MARIASDNGAVARPKPKAAQLWRLLEQIRAKYADRTVGRFHGIRRRNFHPVLMLYRCLVVLAAFAAFNIRANAEIAYAPVIGGVIRTGNLPFGVGKAFEFQYGIDTGTYSVIYLDFAFVDSNGFTRHAAMPNPKQSTLVTVTVANDWANGDYTVKSIMMLDSGGLSTTYNRDGTVTIANGTAIGPTTHSINFAQLDFQVVGAAGPGTPNVFGNVTNITRTSPSPIAANGGITVENYVTLAYAVAAAPDALGAISATFSDPAGFTVTTDYIRGPLPNTGTISMAPSRGWLNGPYMLTTLSLSDFAGRTATYRRDGSVSITANGTSTTSTHTLDFSAADFILTAATAGDIEPRPTALTRSTASVTNPGATSSFAYSLTQLITTAAQIDVAVKDGSSVVRHFVVTGNLPTSGTISGTLDSNWPTGNCQIQYIEIEDVNAHFVRYNRDGTVTGLVDPHSGAPSHTLNLTAGDFYVTRSPVITVAPQSVTVSNGSSATFSVAAAGVSPLSYQWLKGGTPIGGATSATLVLTNVQSADAGSFSAMVTNPLGATTSATGTLTVTSLFGAPIVTAQPTSLTSFVGANATFSLTATGTAPLTYQWRKDGTPINNATSSTYTVSSVQASDAGSYTCVVSNSAGTAISNAAPLTVSGPTAWLTNVSVRTTMTSGQGPLIVGLTVTGGAKGILIRGAGPALANFGLADALVDPRLDIYPGGASAPAFSNDNWDANLAGAFAAVGAFGFSDGSKDAALLPSLDGGYTVQAPATGAGTILVEAYDSKPKTNTPRLTNISARNLVGTGDSILIAGFAIGGTGTKRLLIRAVGPRLSDFGVAHVLADPLVQVYDSNRTLIAENNDWDASLASVFASVGAFSLTTGSKDAALVANLGPGTYTVQVKGADGGIGEAIVELYEVP
jgi:hypothetical protein